MAYGARATAEQNSRDRIAAGSVETLEIEHDEVRAFSLLERADLRVDLEHLRALASREPHRVVAAERSHAAHDAREQRREADLLEAIEPVVARRAVGADADGDARAAQPRDLRDARAELQVRRGAVRDGRLG